MSILFFHNKFFPVGKKGDNFDQDFSFHHERGIAIEDNGVFFASGINEGGEIHFLKNNNAKIKLEDWVLKSFGDPSPEKSDYKIGTYYKRILRPFTYGVRPYEIISQEKLNESFVSLVILLKKLEDLFEVIEPNDDNLLVYGHKIREILLLACMEVESSCSAVLKENQYSKKGFFTSNDYIKLKEVMFLDAYELSLQSYPRFPVFSPFRDWNIEKPTESLVWYKAYNETKHDREGNLKYATLENAVYAVGAVVIMFYAQFGLSFGTGFMDQKSPFIRKLFKTTSVDFKKYEKYFYISKLELDPISEKPTPSIKNYTIEDYPFK